jgi:hypothetical protein
MKKYLKTVPLAVILSCGTSMAFAGSNTDVSQVLDGLQKALNSIDHYHNGNNISQSATNAGNLISETDVDLDDIHQFSATPQIAVNEVSTVFGGWSDITQEATNVVNSLDQGSGAHVDVSTVSQKVNHSADQFAINKIDYSQAIGGIGGANTQTAVNAANLVTTGDINGNIDQAFGWRTLQLAVNSATGGGDASFVDDLAQEATNVANSITANNVNDGWGWWPDVDQTALGAQVALNTIEFGAGAGGGSGSITDTSDLSTVALNASSQAGTNVANLVTLSDLNGTSSQYASVYQKVSDVADYTGPNGGYQLGEVSGFSQTGMNAANLLTAASLPSFSHDLEVSQISDSYQKVSNSLSTVGGLGNITQSATNVANSLSLPSVN